MQATYKEYGKQSVGTYVINKNAMKKDVHNCNEARSQSQKKETNISKPNQSDKKPDAQKLTRYLQWNMQPFKQPAISTYNHSNSQLVKHITWNSKNKPAKQNKTRKHPTEKRSRHPNKRPVRQLNVPQNCRPPARKAQFLRENLPDLLVEVIRGTADGEFDQRSQECRCSDTVHVNGRQMWLGMQLSWHVWLHPPYAPAARGAILIMSVCLLAKRSRTGQLSCNSKGPSRVRFKHATLVENWRG